ncbi:hypothetical protein QFC21_002736 [Naganishia friedmannii]|uniref:Uncharacterized protein n=1 Tax=Naganishia friedmannii TaxID=89922 RepID=A0ACC2VT75_9TREE|nr:hypothetical protein QFC21_002736 [Naganishia friedmannii]
MSSAAERTEPFAEVHSAMIEKARLPPRQLKDEESMMLDREDREQGGDESLENTSRHSRLVQALFINIRQFIDQCVQRTRFSYTRLPDVPQEPQWIFRRISGTPVMSHSAKKAGSNRIKLVAILLPTLLFMVLSMSIVRRYRSWSSKPTSSSSWAGYTDSSVPSSPPTLDVASPYYHSFNLSSLPKSSISTQLPILLQKPRHLPLENGCLEQWFATGTLCSEYIGPQNSLDLVYLWVNGSDPVWQAQYNRTRMSSFSERSRRGTEAAEKRYRLEPPTRHYRSQGSFKYALRSGVEAFTKKDNKDKSWVRKVHVLTADMPVQYDGDVGGRLGQIPDWLDKERVFGSRLPIRTAGDHEQGVERRTTSLDDQPQLQWHFHSEVFRSPILPEAATCASASSPDCSRFQSEEEWVEKVMPSFNSFTIENRMAWIDDLSEYSVQVNDDMFFANSLTSADFHSTLYGSVFRLDHQFGLQVKPILMPSKVSDNGEWGGLQHANWLISQRFPLRPRNYLNHLPKAIGGPLLQEASIMFASDLNVAAQRHFRESGYGVGDISTAFLTTHMRIERWREALLWSWAVARLGAREEGIWGEKAKREIADVLGLDKHSVLSRRKVQIRCAGRDTLKDVPKRFARAKWEPPLTTTFRFSSMDGHLPRIPDDRLPHDDINECTIDLNECFGSAFLHGEAVSSADMFKRVAFERYQCGDCLIMALVNKSGKRGLSAFLPDKKQILASPASSSMIVEQPPHLPLTRSWETTDFSLYSVLKATPGTAERDGQVKLRTWSLLLLSRYQYLSGESPSHFASIKQTFQANNTFKYLRQNPQLGMICLNDDEADSAADQIGGLLHKWLEERWGGVCAWWERAR